MTAPLYARWVALTQRLLRERDGSAVPNDDNWVHNVNLDPRFRVAAGFGADVVEKNAEEYMNDAWQQVGEVLRANSLIRRLQLASGVASRWYERHFKPLAATIPERAFALTAPVQSKIMASPTTVAYTRAASLVPPALTSTALRRVLRPRGRLMRLLPFDASVTPENMLERINAGTRQRRAPTVRAGGRDHGRAGRGRRAAERRSRLGAGSARQLPLAAVGAVAIGIVLAVLLALLLPLAVGLALGLAILAALSRSPGCLWRWEAEEAPALAVQEGDQTPRASPSSPTTPRSR